MPRSSFGLCQDTAQLMSINGLEEILTVLMLNFKNGFSCKSVLLVMKCTIPRAGTSVVRRLLSELLLKEGLTGAHFRVNFVVDPNLLQ
jgi:hypothetical protein